MAAKRVKSAKRPRNGRPLHGKLLSVGLRSSALGPKEVIFDLEPRVTVLTGRNGAGKSAIVESLVSALIALRPRSADERVGVSTFTCRIGFGDEDFSFNFSALGAFPTRLGPRIWRETATRRSRDTIWKVNDGSAVIFNEKIALPSGASLVGTSLPKRPAEMVVLDELVHGFEVLSPKLSWRSNGRRNAVVRRSRSSDGTATWEPLGTQERIERLLGLVLTWAEEKNSPRLKELESVGQRLGLWRSVVYGIATTAAKNHGEPLEYGQIELDGVDLGLLSDGTLHTLEILVALINPTNRFLFIEEPENSIHPGLLSKLMTEIEMYSETKQILLSTHSPVVLHRLDPSAIRLVTRLLSQTTVRSLKKSELIRVKAFLEDEGDLGEWLFGGGASEE